MRNFLPFNPNFPPIQKIQPANQIQQCRLTRSACPDYRYKFPFPNRKANPIHRPDKIFPTAIMLKYILHFKYPHNITTPFFHTAPMFFDTHRNCKSTTPLQTSFCLARCLRGNKLFTVPYLSRKFLQNSYNITYKIKPQNAGNPYCISNRLPS